MSKVGKAYKNIMEEHNRRYLSPEMIQSCFDKVMKEVARDIKNGTFEKKVKCWAKRKKED